MINNETKENAQPFDVVVMGLQLILTAPSDDLANQAKEMVEAIAMRHLTVEELDLAKDQALEELGLEELQS